MLQFSKREHFADQNHFNRTANVFSLVKSSCCFERRTILGLYGGEHTHTLDTKTHTHIDARNKVKKLKIKTEKKKRQLGWTEPTTELRG